MNWESDHEGLSVRLSSVDVFHSSKKLERAAKGSATRTLRNLLCITCSILVALGASLSVFCATLPGESKKLTIEPASVQIGMTYDAYIKRADHKPLTSATVEASEGSGVVVKEYHVIDDDQSLVARLEVRNDATVGTTKLRVKYKDQENKDVEASVDLTVLVKQPLQPQPTPNGIKEVDVMWKVVPYKNVRDNFGYKIAKQYYCLEIVIGNNSQYDLQIASVGFRLNPNKQIATSKVPTNGYRMTRGTLEKDQVFSPRNIVLNFVKALGPVLTGVTPFFHNVSHKGNFSQGINILSDPFEKGIEAIFPDSTIRQLGHLDDQMLRDGLIVHNNLQVRTIAFFPRGFLEFENKGDENKPQKVMEQLGELVLIGDQIAHLNRQVVTASAEGGPIAGAPQSAAGAASFEQGAEQQQLLISGSFLDNAKIEGVPKNVTITQTNVGPNGKSLMAKVTIKHEATPGKYTLSVITPGGAFPFTLNIEQAPPEVNQPPEVKEVDPNSVKSTEPRTKALLQALDKTKENVVKLTITGKHLEQADAVGQGEVQVLEKKNVDGSKLELLLLVPKTAETFSVDVKNKNARQDTKTVSFVLK